jgi:hypothetical protein
MSAVSLIDIREDSRNVERGPVLQLGEGLAWRIGEALAYWK